MFISKDSLSRYERGEQEPGLEVAMRLSRYYEVAIDKLFEIDDSRVESCAFETVCSCGACYNGNSMFSKRLGETVEYLKRKGITKE